MEARVKSSHRWNTVIAFSGSEFVKGEWRQVPAGLEDAAQAPPFLDTREQAPVKEETTTKTPPAPHPNPEDSKPAKKAKARKK
jgi:hypothetical protein